jgi:hypothetical protein
MFFFDRKQQGIAYRRICALLPDIVCGGPEKYDAYMTEEPETRKKYYEHFERQRGKRPAFESESESKQDFRLEGSKLLPTSRIDKALLERTVRELTPGDWVTLSSIEPLPYGTGTFIGLQCVHPEADAQLAADVFASETRFVTIGFAQNGEIRRQSAMLLTKQAADLFVALYTDKTAPDFDKMPGFEKVTESGG